MWLGLYLIAFAVMLIGFIGVIINCWHPYFCRISAEKQDFYKKFMLTGYYSILMLTIFYGVNLIING